jgi:AbrB family looped-hinge helix DNA binding protein
VAKSYDRLTSMAMEVKIDDYGRIVIPKEIRDRLGVDAGTALEIDIRLEGSPRGSVVLRPKGQKPALQQKGELLVHSGRLTDEDFDVVDQIRSSRRKRARKHAGLDT